jgi:uncharacterized low-complexity protein
MSNKIVKPLTVAIGAAFVGSLALTQMANANTAFQVTPLLGGYTLSAPEGKCGEGKCAVAKMAKPGEKAVSKEEAMRAESHACRDGQEGQGRFVLGRQEGQGRFLLGGQEGQGRFLLGRQEGQGRFLQRSLSVRIA